MTVQKLAVLGGGMSSLAAVFSITGAEGWDERYDITIYQMGWRLGGKGATGRNQSAGDRIEEHGYHTLFGFYENVFKVLRDCYAAYDRSDDLPLSAAIAPTKELEALHPERYGLHREDFYIMQQQLADNSWHTYSIDFPENYELPGDGTEYPTFWAYLQMAIELLARLLDHDNSMPNSDECLDKKPSWWERVENFAGHIVKDLDPSLEHHHTHWGALWALRQLVKHLAVNHDPKTPFQRVENDGVDLVVDLLRDYLRLVWAVTEPKITTDWGDYWLWTASDFVCTTLIGTIEDDVFVNGFNSIDDKNFWQWLADNATVPDGTMVTNSSMWVRAAYDSSFAYLQGDSTTPATPAKPVIGNPQLGAGTMLRGGMRLMLTYKGAMAWKFQAGCADVMCSPMYSVLKARGVKFEFFHKVEDIECAVAEDGSAYISGIRVQKQANLASGVDAYDPLITVKQVPCWPSTPKWSELDTSDGIEGHNLESFWTDWTGVSTTTLAKGTDFDLVLLGIPSGALSYITPALMTQSASWATMVNTLKSVRTQAIQTWMTEDLQALGWTGADAPVNTGIEPLDTWADMSQTLKFENWVGPTPPPPVSVQYFCSAAADDPNQPLPPNATYPATQTTVVLQNGVDMFNNHSLQFWPNASTEPGVFNWSLMNAASTVTGADRLGAQFIRNNIDPSERYVLSVPNSVGSRLGADGTDFTNLYICGDWTLNGMNVGCMEATVMSGLMASRAIAGYPQVIPGEFDFPWQGP